MTELVTKTDLEAGLNRIGSQVNARVDLLEAKMDRMSLQLTVRLGALMVAGIGALAVLQRLS